MEAGTRRVVVIDVGANPQQAAALMRERRAGAPVVARGSDEATHLAGAIRDRHLAIAVLARSLSTPRRCRPSAWCKARHMQRPRPPAY